MPDPGWSYRRAGVDIDKHREMHEIALRLAEGLARELGVEVKGLGGYASWIRLGNLDVALHVDGVGTKTLVLERLGKYEVIGWDCVAMNVNDLASAGFRPVALVDYIAMPRGDPGVFEGIMRGLRDAASYSGVAILGGETAILPDLAGGIDAVCTVMGVRASEEYRGLAAPGDILVGLPSSGIHANGYSLVRRILEESIGGYKGVVDGVDLAEELARPTRIYSNIVLEAITEGLIDAAAHITGGGISKLTRILEPGSRALIKPPDPPAIFKVIMRLGRVSWREMYRVFNMGVGMVLAVPRDGVDELLSLVRSHGLEPLVLGRVVRGPRGVVVELPVGESLEYT